MKKFVTCLTAVLFIAAVSTANAAAPIAGSAGNPTVIPPQSVPYGKTYGQWSALFWQWVFASPVSENPLFLDGNVDLSLQQPPGPVWFLGGTFVATPNETGGGVIGQAVRTGTVPAGKALFFPILNNEFDNQTFVPPEDMTIPELYAFAADQLTSNQSMDCEIDGVAVKNLWDSVNKTSPYRVATPVFSYWLPADDNVQQSWGIQVSGTIEPAVGEGVYLMLAPLSPGTHTIHFWGGSPGNFVLDITYNITVVGVAE